MHDVRGEGGQVFLNGLAVADVAPHAVEHGKARPLCRRHEQSASRHQAKESAHLERDRLAARIGAADEQESVFLPQRQRDGNGSFLIEQRVPALDDLQNTFSAHVGLYSVQTIAIFGARIEGVRLRKSIHVRDKRAAKPSDGMRELGKNMGDFLLFVQHQGAQFVVHLEHFLRLDEYGRTALRTVVHEAAHAAFIFRLDGDDKPIAAHGDDAVLQKFALLTRKIALQAGADTLPELSDLGTQGKEFFAGVIGKLVLV